MEDGGWRMERERERERENHIPKVLPTLVGSGRLQPPLSNINHHPGLF